MAGTVQDIMSYPYWPRDKTQDPYRIAGGLISREVEDIGINQEPARGFNQNFVPVLMRPAIKQDTSQMGTQGRGGELYAVTTPGQLYKALLDSVPDPNGQKGGKDGS